MSSLSAGAHLVALRGLNRWHPISHLREATFVGPRSTGIPTTSRMHGPNVMHKPSYLSNIYIGHHLPPPFNHRSLHHRCSKRPPAKHLHRPLLLTTTFLTLGPKPFFYYVSSLFIFNNIILTCLEQEKNYKI